MQEYLQSTAMIDSDSPTLLEAARDIAGNTRLDESVARKLFLWVLDQVQHSGDHGANQVTCMASEVYQYRTGFCYAKSHLLAALLRASGIPAALGYQRLATDAHGTKFCLHGLVEVHLKSFGWYRMDPRGTCPNVLETDFCPPVEKLAFPMRLTGEMVLPERFVNPLPCVVEALQKHHTVEDVVAHLPDFDPTDCGRYQ